MTTSVVRKKKPHELHTCSNANEFLKKMQGMGVDLQALISEIVKPEYPIGVVLGGSIPEQTATYTSDVDITLLLTDINCLKEFKSEIWGCSIFYLHKDRAQSSNWTVMIYKGIEINFEFKLNSDVSVQDNTKTTAPQINTGDIHEVRFLSRLASGWSLYNHELVSQWKTHYSINEMCGRRTISEFTLALKELEDMKAAIGTSSGLPLIIGVHVVTQLIKSILATESYYSPGIKWMRKVNQLITSDNKYCSRVLSEAKPLLFQTYTDNEEHELAFYKDVIQLTKSVETYIVSKNHYVGDVLDWFKEEFDMVNEL